MKALGRRRKGKLKRLEELAATDPAFDAGKGASRTIKFARSARADALINGIFKMHFKAIGDVFGLYAEKLWGNKYGTQPNALLAVALHGQGRWTELSKILVETIDKKIETSDGFKSRWYDHSIETISNQNLAYATANWLVRKDPTAKDLVNRVEDYYGYMPGTKLIRFMPAASGFWPQCSLMFSIAHKCIDDDADGKGRETYEELKQKYKPSGRIFYGALLSICHYLYGQPELGNLMLFQFNTKGKRVCIDAANDAWLMRSNYFDENSSFETQTNAALAIAYMLQQKHENESK